MARLIEIADRPTVGNLLAFGQVQEVDDRPAASIPTQLRQIVDLAPIDLTPVGEEQQIGVRAGHEEVLDGVFLFGLGALESLAAATLGPIDTGRRPLDVPVAAERNDHRLFGDQVFQVDLAELLAADLGASRVAVLAFQLAQVVADDGQDVLLVGEDPVVLDDLLQEFGMFAAELLLFEVDQLAQGHLQDRVGLDRCERIVLADPAFLLQQGESLVAQGAPQHGGRGLDLHQPLLRLGLRLRRTDHADHLVDIRMGQKQTLDRVFPLSGFGQKELRATADHRYAMPDEFLENLFKRQHPGLAVDQGQQVDREAVLQRRELEKLIEHHVRIGVALELDDQPDRLFQVALVADARDAGHLAAVDRGRNTLLDPVAGLLVGDFGDHDPCAILAEPFDFRFGTHHNRTAARVVTAANGPATANHAAGREVGAGDDLQQFVYRDARVVDHLDQGVANLTQVVRRDRRGHTHRDAAGPVDQ